MTPRILATTIAALALGGAFFAIRAAEKTGAQGAPASAKGFPMPDEKDRVIRTEEEWKKLADMQEAARKEGMGAAVYDP